MNNAADVTGFAHYAEPQILLENDTTSVVVGLGQIDDEGDDLVFLHVGSSVDKDLCGQVLLTEVEANRLADALRNAAQ